MRGKKGGEMLSEGLRMFTGAISGRSLWQGNLVVLFDVVCLMHVVKDGVLKRYC